MLRLGDDNWVEVPVLLLKEAKLGERTDLQRRIVSSPDAFFHDLGEKLLLLDDEVTVWAGVLGGERIDLLALDEDGRSVVVELKRGADPRQLLQGLSYAAVIAKWPQDRLVHTLANSKHGGDTQAARDAISEFISSELDTINKAQRIVLVAESFPPIVIATAEWLVEQYGLDIKCYRVTLHQDGEVYYLTSARIYPPVGAIQTPQGGGEASSYTSWEEFFGTVKNAALAKFFRENIAEAPGRQAHLGSKMISYYYNGKKRFSVKATLDYGYGWQNGRFSDDIGYWRGRISDPDSVKEAALGAALRFLLRSAEDFATFRHAVEVELRAVKFLPNAIEEPALESQEAPS